MDWRNYLIAVLATWISASFVMGRWSQSRESTERDLERRVSRLEGDVNSLLGLRANMDRINIAIDNANTEQSRLTGMIQKMIGKIDDLTQLAIKLDT